MAAGLEKRPPLPLQAHHAALALVLALLSCRRCCGLVALAFEPRFRGLRALLRRAVLLPQLRLGGLAHMRPGCGDDGLGAVRLMEQYMVGDG